MRVVIDKAKTDSASSTLIVMLPGAYNAPEDFVREGFVQAARGRYPDVDIMLVDMSIECITSGLVIEELHSDIAEVVSTNTYRHIWLLGISIGGFYAIVYAEHYPQDIEGVLLIAPYPGNRSVTNEIKKEGGIRNWSPSHIEESDHERRIWQWLKNHHAHTIKVHLGFGDDDRFAGDLIEMASIFPSDRVIRVTGKHDWETWRKIWNNFLVEGNL